MAFFSSSLLRPINTVFKLAFVGHLLGTLVALAINPHALGAQGYSAQVLGDRYTQPNPYAPNAFGGGDPSGLGYGVSQNQGPYIMRVLRSWHGQPANRLISQWGQPSTGFMRRDGKTILIWAPKARDIELYHENCVRKIIIGYSQTVDYGEYEGNCDPASNLQENTSQWPYWPNFS